MQKFGTCLSGDLAQTIDRPGSSSKIENMQLLTRRDLQAARRRPWAFRRRKVSYLLHREPAQA